jgi:hypothetical protein
VSAIATLELDARAAQAIYQLDREDAADELPRESTEKALSRAAEGARRALRYWSKTRESLHRGKVASDARRETEEVLQVMNAWRGLLGLVCADGEAVARREGAAPAGLAEAQAVHAELPPVVAELHRILDHLARPTPSVDREQLQKAREDYSRGEGFEDVEDVLARRKARARP